MGKLTPSYEATNTESKNEAMMKTKVCYDPQYGKKTTAYLYGNIDSSK